MPIKDLFSHKIHSGGDDWPDKLIELAFLFNEFDGQPYDRDKIESRLKEISPRYSFVARDASKFRDEYSAYPAYFGLYHQVLENGVWIIRLSDTAKRYLIQEEPDVGAFLRIQMTLFQYPNGMGATYYSGGDGIRVQANTCRKTLGYINENIHLSPLRLIVIALKADSKIRKCSLFDAQISYKEIFALANDPNVNTLTLPSIGDVEKSINKIRDGRIEPPQRFESRFHLLKHLEIFEIGNQQIRLRKPANELDEADIKSKFETISQITHKFKGFDRVGNKEKLVEKIKSGEWSKYFDGLNTLKLEQVMILESDVIKKTEEMSTREKIIDIQITPTKYPLSNRGERPSAPKPTNRKNEFADPEVTRIKRERRNLAHKILVDNMHELLKQRGARPMENAHIDLYGKIPDDGSFLFEMKSTGEKLIDQVIKGIGQLYEYRYRYKDKLNKDVKLCLVLEKSPDDFPWLIDYLCEDRKINLCWFDEKGNLSYPENCKEAMQELLR